MTRLLFHSNAPFAPTGYGIQCGLFAPKIAEEYEEAISTFYGLEGSRLEWRGIQLFPGVGQDFGNLYLLEHAERWFGGDPRGGLVLTLLDVWVLNPQLVGLMNTVAWTPVDHDPAPPKVLRWFHDSGAIPLAMSRFGEERLEQFNPIYVPHGVDVDAFKPLPKAEVRAALGFPKDAFVIGMVAANKGRPSRKGFQQAFEAFRILREQQEDAILYLHTILNPKWAGGEELLGLLASLEIPLESVKFADQYQMGFNPFTPNQMAAVYSCMDVLLNPATGEGFGVPIIEAAACGVPAIVTDFSAMPEVAGPGWKVRGHPWWTGHESWMRTPDVGAIVEALEDCYTMTSRARDELSKDCRKHAMTYAAERVWREHLRPALRECEERIGAPPAALEEVVA